MRTVLWVVAALLISFVFAVALLPACILHSHLPANEGSAIASLVSIRDAQGAYSTKHSGDSFAPDLSALAMEHAIDERLANGRKGGYTFSYATGRALQGQRFGELWRCRAGDYRLIGEIQDEQLVIFSDQSRA